MRDIARPRISCPLPEVFVREFIFPARGRLIQVTTDPTFRDIKDPRKPKEGHVLLDAYVFHAPRENGNGLVLKINQTDSPEGTVSTSSDDDVLLPQIIKAKYYRLCPEPTDCHIGSSLWQTLCRREFASNTSNQVLLKSHCHHPLRSCGLSRILLICFWANQ